MIMTWLEIQLQEHMQSLLQIAVSFWLGYMFALAMEWLGRRK